MCSRRARPPHTQKNDKSHIKEKVNKTIAKKRKSEKKETKGRYKDGGGFKSLHQRNALMAVAGICLVPVCVGPVDPCTGLQNVSNAKAVMICGRV